MAAGRLRKRAQSVQSYIVQQAGGTDGLIKIGIAAAGIGIASYFVYKLINPGVAGGPCNDPASPCGQALAGPKAQFQACLEQYTQLMTNIAQSGVAPNPGQVYTIQQLNACMDQAAAQIAAIGKLYQPQDNIAELVKAIAAAIIIAAIGKFGLPGLADAIARYRSQGKISTNGNTAEAATTLIMNSTIQYAVEQNLIPRSVASVWQTDVSNVTSSSITSITSFWNTLVLQSIVDASIAATEIQLASITFAADAAVSLAVLGAL